MFSNNLYDKQRKSLCLLRRLALFIAKAALSLGFNIYALISSMIFTNTGIEKVLHGLGFHFVQVTSCSISNVVAGHLTYNADIGRLKVSISVGMLRVLGGLGGKCQPDMAC